MSREAAQITYDLSLLEGSRAAWERSAGLRAFYGELYRSISAVAVPGACLEIGAGIGVARDFIPGAVLSDLVQTDYVDCAMSAYEIQPGPDGEWANVFAVDVLHHLRSPFRFFASAAGQLAPGGRIILMEPAATYWGRIFYRCCHHEPIRPDEVKPPYEFEPNGDDRQFANMGMGVGLFERERTETDRRLAELGLRCHSLHYRDVLAYPLTGGYSKPQCLPAAWLRQLLQVERHLPQWFLRRGGLRMRIVLEKLASRPPDTRS
jgi:SAM-dependent methyltransferase